MEGVINFQIKCNQDDMLKFIQQILTSNNPQTTPNSNNISTQTSEEYLILDFNQQIVEEDDLPEVIQPPTVPTDRDSMPPKWANQNIKINVTSAKGINRTTKKNGEKIQTSTWLRHQNYKNAANLLEYWKLGGTFSDYKRDIKNGNIEIFE